MKILFSPFSNPVTESELTVFSEICQNLVPDRIILCFPEDFTPDSLTDDQKRIFLSISNTYDSAIFYYDVNDSETLAAILKAQCNAQPDADFVINHMSASEAAQAALIPLIDDPAYNTVYATIEATEPDAAPEETAADTFGDIPEAGIPEEEIVNPADPEMQEEAADDFSNAADDFVPDDTAAEPEKETPVPEDDVPAGTDETPSSAQDAEKIKKDAVSEFGKAMLAELVDSYDYHGALVLSKKLGDTVPEIVPFLLEAADMRSDGRFADANQMFRKCSLEGIMTGQQSVVEYYLLLDLYIKEERYIDFLRAVKPFLLEIMIAAIRKEFNMDITRYMIYGSRRWDENKLVLEQMTGKFNETFAYHTKPKPCKAGGYVTTAHLSNLMENLSVQRQHAGLILDTMKLRLNCEERVKTLAFYNMQGVTAQDIEKLCACRPEDLLLSILNYLRNHTDFTVSDEMLNSYQQMNEMIKSYL